MGIKIQITRTPKEDKGRPKVVTVDKEAAAQVVEEAKTKAEEQVGAAKKKMDRLGKRFAAATAAFKGEEEEEEGEEEGPKES